MMTSVGLKQLFLLCSMLWTCTGDWSAIQVRCTKWWFFAKIKPTIFNNVYMRPEEAFLGDDCPVTYHLPGVYYEFFYHPYDCGIKNMVFQECLVMKTKIKYISRDSDSRAEMPLLCVVRNQHAFLNGFSRRDHENSSEMESRGTMKMHTASEDTNVASAMQPRHCRSWRFCYSGTNVCSRHCGSWRSCYSGTNWKNPNDTCVANGPLITEVQFDYSHAVQRQSLK